MRNVTRREFLIASSVLAGVTTGCLSSGGRILSTGKANAAGADFPESSCGSKSKADKKILVAYASSCGSTGGVAEAIGRVLCDAGADVDIRLVKRVEDISSYRAVVLGSAVQRASWLPEAIAFVKNHREALSRAPVAYFLTCLALYHKNDDARKLAQSYMEPVLKEVPEVRPLDSGFFAGVLDYSKMNMIVRMVMKAKMRDKGVPEGDFRDWSTITSWAKGLTALM